MNDSVTISVSKGYEKKCWLAQITGLDDDGRCEFDFLSPDERAGEPKPVAPEPTTISLSAPVSLRIATGGYSMVWQDAVKGMRSCTISAVRAKQMARLFDEGRISSLARVATKPGPVPGSPKALQAEREKLMARIAEIDQALAIAKEDTK